MQTSKPRVGALEVPQRTSRKLKTSGSDHDNGLSQSPATRISLEQSPKIGRRSPCTPSSEKKRPGRVSELESQVAQLEEELKKTKDQLSQAKPSTNQAHQEAEEANNKHAAQSEASITSPELELSKTLDLVEDLKTQLKDSKDSEFKALEIVKTLGSQKLDAMKAYDSLSMELEQTKAEMGKNKLLIEKLQKPGSNEEKDSENETNTKNLDSLGMELEQTKAELEENKKLIEKLQNHRSKEEKDSENGTKMKKLESDFEELKRVVFDKETELVAAQVELRRVKVQSEQWRKAAEVAAAMLSGGNGKYVLDSNYCEEMEDESPKKRNGNMLKKIGVLLKKK